MALEIKQNLKLTQQLVMTPQLQQAIKLLQLSRLELLDLIREEIKENPVLEERQETPTEKTEQETQITEEFGNTDGIGQEVKETPQETDFDWRDYLYEDAQTPWDPLSRMRSGDSDDENRRFVERSAQKKGDLQSHLLEQLSLSSLAREEMECGELIIGNLDQNGYLTASLEELAAMANLDEEIVKKALKDIQKFDPPGVAARDLRECLLLQLSYLKEKDCLLVEQVLLHHMSNLGTKKYRAIARDLNVTQDEVIEAVKLINSLDPKPGRAFTTEDPQYINPDLYVYKVEEDYIVLLNEDGMPRLHINSFYRHVLTQKAVTSDDSKEYIKGKLRSAVWLIKSIYHRQNTLRNVMYSIIKFQREFFDKGISKLRPLVLREVAEDINMHESTVSRVTNNKYVHTSHGIFPLKFFFNSSINSVVGANLASESVKEIIRKIVSGENSRSPYSDQKITEILRQRNVNIARRTVTKYREMMSILPSNKRKSVF
jgi:RNA polymerase sigma-54 factor